MKVLKKEIWGQVQNQYWHLVWFDNQAWEQVLTQVRYRVSYEVRYIVQGEIQEQRLHRAINQTLIELKGK